MAEETILERAQRLIHGDRNDAYGHPLDDFQCTADCFRAVIKRKYGFDVPLIAEDVGLFMVLVKVSRHAHKFGSDNLADGAGYFGTLEMIEEERGRRASGDTMRTAAEACRPLKRQNRTAPLAARAWEYDATKGGWVSPDGVVFETYKADLPQKHEHIREP